MIYGKIVIDGYVCAATTGGGAEITESEYNEIMSAIQSKPSDPDGYQYRLRADNLEWELVELPTEPEEPITEDEALTRYANELTGGSDETLEEATETLLKYFKEGN